MLTQSIQFLFRRICEWRDYRRAMAMPDEPLTLEVGPICLCMDGPSDITLDCHCRGPRAIELLKFHDGLPVFPEVVDVWIRPDDTRHDCVMVLSQTLTCEDWPSETRAEKVAAILHCDCGPIREEFDVDDPSQDMMQVKISMPRGCLKTNDPHPVYREAFQNRHGISWEKSQRYSKLAEYYSRLAHGCQ